MSMDSLLDLQRKWDRASRWYDFATAALEAVRVNKNETHDVKV
jgi:hypothetical protein